MTIGIPGWMVGPNSFGLTISYMEFIRSLGCDDIRILAPDSPVWTDLDLLILTGGADINPSRYNEMPGFYTDKPDIIKEYFDVHILPRYIENKTPVFGICRGMQTIAVHFGGTLIQNIWHATNKQEDPCAAVHGLTLANGNKGKIEVNSRHHQSVRNPVGDSKIRVLAVHDKVPWHVEAIRIQDRDIVGVQWHPEDLDETSGINYTMSLIKSILK